MAAIDLKGVGKAYQRQTVIEDLDLSIGEGAFAVILGPSGCGKSTLLRMIAGLEEISSGTVTIGGRRVNDLEPRARGCAMVFQNYALYPHMSVAQNIGYALKVAGIGRAERDARVRRVAEALGLVDYLDRRPAALSGGQRQRVAMGRAMIREPQVFLFDEPLSNLDAKLRVQMRLEIRRLHARLKATSVFVTHDQVEAMTLADVLVVMNRGRVEQVGRPHDVYRRPATRFVAEFIGSPPMNILPGRGDGSAGVSVGGGRLALPPGIALAAADAVDVGFRAEDAILVQAGEPHALPFTLELAEDLGATLLLHGRIGDHAIVLSVPAERALPPDGRLHVLVPREAMHLFGAQSGARIEPTSFALAAE